MLNHRGGAAFSGMWRRGLPLSAKQRKADKIWLE